MASSSRIHHAVACRNLKEVQRLIQEENGLLDAPTTVYFPLRCDENVAGFDQDSTPLMMAAAVGETEMVSWLLDFGAQVERVDALGRTALYHACWQGHVAVISLLLQRGADINKAKTRGDRWTPLTRAICSGHFECVRRLLSYKAINWNAVDNEGKTALHWSCSKSFSDITKLLLDRGADPTIADNGGRTPFAEARRFTDQECMRLLKAALAEPERVRILHKLRSIHDAEHVIRKARNDAASCMPEERKRKTIAAASAYFKKRVEVEEELPVIEARHGDEENEKIAAALEYVTAGNKLPKEVFIELLNMMLPPWDEERKRRWIERQ